MNESPYKIHGSERKRLKSELSRLGGVIKHWSWCELAEEMYTGKRTSDEIEYSDRRLNQLKEQYTKLQCALAELKES